MTLSDLQKALIKNNLDAYIITRNNMFLGQDILPAENKLFELTNFSGSAGNLIVFRDDAVLLVDGRYELQASLEVDTSKIKVVCTKETIATWIQNNLTDPCNIAFDPWCHSINEVDYWNRALKKHSFIEDSKQLLGSRLSNKEVEIFEQDIKFSGISTDEKVSYLTNFMREKQLDAFFLSSCDSVSWLMNLRSDCLPDTPVIRAFALIDKDGGISLFTNDFKKIETELAACRNLNIGLTYGQTPKQIQTIMKNHRIWLVNFPDPVQGWKAVKNPVELSGFIRAHHRDGLAVTRFLHWLDNNWQGQDEQSIEQKLYQFRSSGEYFYGNSFETIAASGSNGAIVHYHATDASNRTLQEGSMLLLDSGAQYYDGTTDITRTIAIGKPSSEMIESFTEVLKAHIACASAIFPAGTSGCSLDALARAQLWQSGKDYNHGTGHGVGHFLNVHEGPHSLSPRSTSVPLAAGMITSIEPGYYKAGEYGIRIENLAVVKNADDDRFTMPMLKFEPLTLAPIDKRLINKYLLTNKEIAWLDNYHHQVFRQLAPELDLDVRKWLEQACSPL